VNECGSGALKSAYAFSTEWKRSERTGPVGNLKWADVSAFWEAVRAEEVMGVGRRTEGRERNEMLWTAP
jgi:hypothetical protein